MDPLLTSFGTTPNSTSVSLLGAVVLLLSFLGAMGLAKYLRKQARAFTNEHGRRIIDGFLWRASRYAGQAIRARSSMRRYCNSRLGDAGSRSLHVPGFRDTALDVDEVYVPLTLESGGYGRTYTSLNLLEAGGRLLIMGDPGSGKSTLVKKVYRDTCRQTAEKPGQGRLPILRDLKNLNPPAHLTVERDLAEWLLNELREQVAQVEGFEMAELFDTWLSGPGLFVLLDGMDEVASDRYVKVATALRGLSQRLSEKSPGNAVVVTMRVQFYQQVRADLLEDYPKTLYVRPFSPNEIFLFLQRWPFASDREKNANRVYRELNDRPTLRDLCGNPLVLAMYTQRDWKDGNGKIPESRTEFYSRVVEELLVMRRQRQIPHPGRLDTEYREREAFLGRLALEHLMDPDQPANSLDWKRALVLGGQTWKCSEVEAARRLRQLASVTGIISEERRGESYRFIHLTFCEFLAAKECADGEENGWRRLIDRHRAFRDSLQVQNRTRLSGTLPFAHALLRRGQKPEKALADVADLGDRSVLGQCFLETQLYETRQWPEYFHAERNDLMENEGREWDEARLRQLHAFSVVVRDAAEWAERTERTPDPDLGTVFEKIVSGNRERLLTIFTSHASQDAAAAFSLADQVGVNLLTDHSELLVESCQEKPFLALALDRALEGVPDQRAPWSRILVEAALRYENVAQRLDELAVRNQDHNHRGSREKAPLEAMTRPGSAYHRVLQQADVRSTEREELPATSCLIKIGDSRFGGKASILRSTILMIIPFAVAGSVAAGLFYSIFLFLESILGKEGEQPLPYPAIALIFTFLLVAIYILELTRAREFHFLLTLNTVNFNTDAGLHKTPTAAMIYLALSSYSARRDLRTLLRLLDIRNGTSSSDTPELNGLKLARHARARISGNS